MNKAIFIDRDGTLNKEKRFLYKPDEFEFTYRAPEAIKILNDLGFIVIVITNQSGVARGYYTEKDVDALHKYIDYKLAETSAKIQAYYYCPHHPDATIEKYKTECNCRKPKTGLFEIAINQYNIDVSNSYIVGDKISDLVPGDILGLNKALVLTGYGNLQQQTTSIKFCIYRDLISFAENLDRKLK